MECPKCRAEIGNADYCGCGWKKPKKQEYQEPLRVECAHESCQHRAIVKIQTITGWANLCNFHYQEHYRLQALDYCSALGLHTTEQRKAWMKGAIRKLAEKWKPDYQREPGEDEEYMHTKTRDIAELLVKGDVEGAKRLRDER